MAGVHEIGSCLSVFCFYPQGLNLTELSVCLSLSALRCSIYDTESKSHLSSSLGGKFPHCCREIYVKTLSYNDFLVADCVSFMVAPIWDYIVLFQSSLSPSSL